MNINIEVLLQPIDSKSPVGENIEYELVYNEIRQARESDPEYLSGGEWSITEPRSADWKKVRNLCEQVLRYQSKDFQISCWYVESLTYIYGPEGLAVGCDYLSEFISRFWENCWPSIDEGPEMRYSKLIKLDKDIVRCLNEYPILKRKDINLSYWYKVRSFEHNLIINPERRDEIIASEGDYSIKTFEKLTSNISPSDISAKLHHLVDIPHKLDELESCYFFNSKDIIHGVFNKTRECISDLTVFLNKLAPAMMRANKSQLDSEVLIEESVAPYISNLSVGDNETLKKNMSRELALKQMKEIADFFRETEPSSPVPYLIERAVRWANMSVTDWLNELLPDKEVIHKINEVLKGNN
ncbi:type VI secretion system protein TssA [Escherichia coli]|uniref:type VI secretion system protein TssA n=1 Tax=Escherichia coli TaxID=562 RepID=UPI000BE55858|nr:type VI secretion system protein TssA [Escherichia coli]EIQ0266893.1 type VI secretion system protein TssA [Escherichia coli]